MYNKADTVIFGSSTVKARKRCMTSVLRVSRGFAIGCINSGFKVVEKE